MKQQRSGSSVAGPLWAGRPTARVLQDNWIINRPCGLIDRLVVCRALRVVFLVLCGGRCQRTLYPYPLIKLKDTPSQQQLTAMEPKVEPMHSPPTASLATMVAVVSAVPQAPPLA